MHFSEFGREGLIIQGRERGMAVGRLGVMEKGREGDQKHKSRHLYHAITPL